MIDILTPSILAALSILQGSVLPVTAFQTASVSLHRPRLPVQPTAFAIQHNHHPVAATKTSSILRSTTVEDPDAPELDTDAITKYIISAIVELGLFSAIFQLLDMTTTSLDIQLPFPAIAFLFYACSLKSRVFNPLNNQRPNRSKAIDGKGSSGFKDRVMPAWTPPGFIFPIMWLLIIGPIRAYTSAVVVTTTGSFFTLPTMAFLLHLTVGEYLPNTNLYLSSVIVSKYENCI